VITAGKPAPDVSAPTDTGDTLSLRDLRGQWVVLFFYPKAGTAG
jgi:peroxiredoxin Q/BCP